MNPETASIQQGDLVDVAFNPQVNEYRSDRTPQMNVLDIRPSCRAACPQETSGYRALLADRLTEEIASLLLPDRPTLGMVWRYLARCTPGQVQDTPICLCRKMVRWSGVSLSVQKMLVCLDIFSDVGLLETQRYHKYIMIRLMERAGKADLNESQTMQRLLQVKES